MLKASREPRGRVIRAPTPPRGAIDLDARETLWTLARPSDESIVRVDLVALTDAAEVETFANDRLRRRWRFLRDAGARGHAERLRRRLTARGFQPVAA